MRGSVISPSSSIRAWLAALDTLDAMKPARVVPSHGEMGDAAMIGDYRRFLVTVQRRAAELKAQGVSAAEAEARITKELQAGYAGRQPGRIGGAVRVAWAEATP